jgi:hypothetical protein
MVRSLAEMGHAVRSFAVLGLLATSVFMGCAREERVVDIDTPGADVAVDRNIDTGEIEVETDED